MKIMAQSFRLGPVNHPDRALEPRPVERAHDFLADASQIDPKSVESDFVKQFLVASTQRRANTLAFRFRAPIGRSGHAAAMGAESNQHRLFSEALANQLANVQFPMLAIFRRTRVAELGIMRPNNRFSMTAPVQ